MDSTSAASWHNQGLDVDSDTFVKGMVDALGKNKPLLSETELRDVVQTFVKQAQAQAAARQKVEGEKNKKAGEAFLAANAKKKGVIVLKSGLQYQVLKSGKGKSSRETDRVRTHYHGTLIDGTVFDSSVERGKPAVFQVNRVIKGWFLRTPAK